VAITVGDRLAQLDVSGQWVPGGWNRHRESVPSNLRHIGL